MLELPDDVVVYPSHYGGSVCGRGRSGNQFRSIGFERSQNPMLRNHDADSFAARAEAALAQAKRAGRGTVDVADSDDPPQGGGVIKVAAGGGETILEA